MPRAAQRDERLLDLVRVAEDAGEREEFLDPFETQRVFVDEAEAGIDERRAAASGVDRVAVAPVLVERVVGECGIVQRGEECGGFGKKEYIYISIYIYILYMCVCVYI